MLDVKVTGGEISEAEKKAYIERGLQKYKGQVLSGIDIHLDGEFVELTYHLAPANFDRIRRITGYLVGGMNRWNNAKRAEEGDRVKHIGRSTIPKLDVTPGNPENNDPTE